MGVWITNKTDESETGLSNISLTTKYGQGGAGAMRGRPSHGGRASCPHMAPRTACTAVLMRGVQEGVPGQGTPVVPSALGLASSGIGYLRLASASGLDQSQSYIPDPVSHSLRFQITSK